MLSFLAMVLLIYGTMYFYLLSKMRFAFPHAWTLAAGLCAAGIALTCASLLVWLLERRSWHRPTVITARNRVDHDYKRKPMMCGLISARSRNSRQQVVTTAPRP